MYVYDISDCTIRMYNVVRPSDKVYKDNNFKRTNNVPTKSSKRLSLRSTNQYSEDEDYQEDSFEECDSPSDEARPSLNPRYEKIEIQLINYEADIHCRLRNENLKCIFLFFRLKRSLNGSASGANQRALRGTEEGSNQPILDSTPNVEQNLVKNSQIQRSHETVNNVVKTSRQKENISKSSRSSSNASKELTILENGFLQEELVKAVQNHFLEKFKLNKPSKKLQKDQQKNPSKDESSDDDIEGS